MAEPCRVLVLNERDPRHPKAGGAEIHVAEIFGRLAKRGFAVTQLCAGFRGGARRETLDGLQVERLGPLPLYYPRSLWRCARDTRAGRYDVVVECLNKVPFYAPRHAAVPVVALCHHLFGEVAFQQVGWPIATAVWVAERFIPSLYCDTPFITISESSRDDLVARGIDPAHIRVSHCGVTPPARPGLAYAERPQRVCYVGRLEPYKRIDVFLRAMVAVAERFPEVEVEIIGRGSARAELETLARALGLASRTHFAGFVSDAERDAMLGASRVCVCPSEKEGWGLTVIEANALGTPVVASDAPGLRDSVRDAQTGFLARFGDPEAFADRIAALLADEALAAATSRAALAWSRHFDWDRAADDMAAAIAAARREG